MLKQLVKWIPTAFEIIGIGFDKIPALNRLKGYRSAICLIAMGVINGIDYANIGPGNLGNMLNPYLVVFTGLSLNASGRTAIKALKK